MGRPKGFKLVDNPKNETFKFRMDKETAEKLEKVSRVTEKTKAEVIRNGIEIQFEQLK